MRNTQNLIMPCIQNIIMIQTVQSLIQIDLSFRVLIYYTLKLNYLILKNLTNLELYGMCGG